MTKSEAIQALKDGKKVRHGYFSKDEWVKQTGNRFEFEDGVICDPMEFWHYRQGDGWKTGWEIINNVAT